MTYLKNRFPTLAFASLALIVAVSVMLFAPAAQAAPLAFGKSAISHSEESVLMLVRDNCGRGMRFSNSRGHCVEDFSGGPRNVEPGCPRGMRFSNSRGRCVPMDGGNPGAAILKGLLGGGGGSGRRGDGCGRGMRFSNSRQACVPI